MAKPHLTSRELPIRTWGGEMAALCGRVVPNAEMVLMWDEAVAGKFWTYSEPDACQRCLDQVGLIESDVELYFYGIYDGSKIKRRKGADADSEA